MHHIRTQNGPVTKPLNLDPGTFLASHLSLKAVSSAIGIYEYEAQSRVGNYNGFNSLYIELDVHVGSKFSILARDGEWSVVERNGQRGSVPTSCIYEATTKQNRSQVFVFCIYDYSRRSKNELNVQRGDKLKLLERYHHWCLVQHHDMALIDEGAVGLVPFTYLSSGDSAPTSGDIRRSQSVCQLGFFNNSF
jgi:SH3 domain